MKQKIDTKKIMNIGVLWLVSGIVALIFGFYVNSSTICACPNIPLNTTGASSCACPSDGTPYMVVGIGGLLIGFVSIAMRKKLANYA